MKMFRGEESHLDRAPLALYRLGQRPGGVLFVEGGLDLVLGLRGLLPRGELELVRRGEDGFFDHSQSKACSVVVE